MIDTEYLDTVQEVEDWLTEVIDSSLGPDWTSRDAARQILNRMIDKRDYLTLAYTGGGTKPDCSGSFQGDLWYGELAQPALPTHQWDALNWRRLKESERRNMVAQ
jgi:hypothetical protein